MICRSDAGKGALVHVNVRAQPYLAWRELRSTRNSAHPHAKKEHRLVLGSSVAKKILANLVTHIAKSALPHAPHFQSTRLKEDPQGAVGVDEETRKTSIAVG